MKLSRPGWWRLLRSGFSLAVIAVLAVVCVRAVRDLSSLSLHVHVWWLVIAWPLALAAFPLLAVSWSRLLLAYGQRVGVAAAVRLWCLAQASRYLPTGAAAVASRAVLATRMGVPRSLSVVTMAVEGVLLLAWSSLAAGSLVLAGGYRAVLPLAAGGLLAVLAMPGALVVAGRAREASTSTHRLLAWVLRITRRLTRPDPGPLVGADLILGASMAVKGLVFLLFAKALLPVRASDVALLVGAGNLAVVAGMIGVTPAGIGVREGVMIGLLSHRFGVANATGLAVTLRVWDLTVELPWILGSVAVNRRRPHWRGGPDGARSAHPETLGTAAGPGDGRA